MTIILEDELAQGFRSALHVRPTRSGDLVVLPQTFGDGRAVAIEVQQLDEDTFQLTDRGLTADILADHQVDLEKGARASWLEIVRSIRRAPSLQSDQPYALTAQTDRNGLAVAVEAIAAAMLRAEGLRVFAPRFQPVTYSQRILARLHHDLGDAVEITTNAPLRGRHGTQNRVTAKLDAPAGAFYMQALSGGDQETRQRNYQRGYTIFATASLDDARGLILAENLDGWNAGQVQDLRDVVTVLDGDDVPGVRSLLAA